MGYEDLINNAVNVTQTTKETFIPLAHKITAIPSLIILFFFIFLILLIVGLTMVRQSRSKFMQIYFITFVIGVVLLTGLIYLPNVVNIIAEFITRSLGL